MKNKGITLIALVVTIIVLLILAGITITLVMGQNGLIAKAMESGKNYTEAENTENEGIAKLDNTMEEYVSTGRDNNYTVTRKLVAEGEKFRGVPSKEYDISKITDKYKELTTENFSYTSEFYTSFVRNYDGTFYLRLSYENETGILTATSTSLNSPGVYFANFQNVNIYVYY